MCQVKGEQSTNPSAVPCLLLLSLHCQPWGSSFAHTRCYLRALSAMELIAIKQVPWLLPNHCSGFLISHIRGSTKKEEKKKSFFFTVVSCASAVIGLVLKKLPREMKHSAYSLLMLAIAAYGIKLLSQRLQGKDSVLTASSRTESLLE